TCPGQLLSRDQGILFATTSELQIGAITYLDQGQDFEVASCNARSRLTGTSVTSYKRGVGNAANRARCRLAGCSDLSDTSCHHGNKSPSVRSTRKKTGSKNCAGI